LARSRELLSGAESLRERARALRGGDEGIIRVGVAPLTLESLMPTFLAQHQRRHPKIDVRLAEADPVRLWAQLERGELNLAISFPGHEGLGSRLLFPVWALSVMPADHRLARRTAVKMSWQASGCSYRVANISRVNGSILRAGRVVCGQLWHSKVQPLTH